MFVGTEIFTFVLCVLRVEHSSKIKCKRIEDQSAEIASEGKSGSITVNSVRNEIHSARIVAVRQKI